MNQQGTDTAYTDEEARAADGRLDEEELAKQITDNIKLGKNHLSDWRRKARESYDFYASNQWDSDDAATLREEQRPVVTMNRVARTINALAGLEVQNRQEVRYLPRKFGLVDDNSGESDVLNGAKDWVRDGCDAEDEESDAFQDLGICGMGWVETRMDYETDVEGKIIIERIDPLDMVYDPCAKKHNLSDARWVARIKEFSREEMRRLWPDYNLGGFTAPSSFWNDNEQGVHDQTEAHLYRNDQSDKLSKPKSITVIQYQWYDTVFVYKVADESGNIVDFTPEKFMAAFPILEAKAAMTGVPPQFAKVRVRKYYQAFVCGSELLESKQELHCNHFTFQSMTGLRDRNTNTWFGLVELMKDPQRWANKWLSQIQNIINKGAKNGLIIESDAVSNIAKFEEDFAKPGSVSRVNPGALSQNKIMPKEAPRYPDGVDRLLQYAITAINDVTGVNLELIGMADRDQPIGLEETRKSAGLTILAPFFDSLRKYRKAQGRVLAYFIQNYISDGRLIKIVGKQGAQYVPLAKNAVAFEYDIIVDDSPTSTNSKEKTFYTLSQIIPMCLQAGIPVPPSVLKYAPLPEPLVQEWMKIIDDRQRNAQGQELEQIKKMLAYIEIEKGKAEIGKIDSETQKNYAQAEQAHATGQDESAQAAQKMGIAHGERIMKEDAMRREQARKDLEALLNHRRKEIESQQTMQLKQQESAANLQIKREAAKEAARNKSSTVH